MREQCVPKSPRGICVCLLQTQQKGLSVNLTAHHGAVHTGFLILSIQPPEP